ncbi:radical SAM protein [Rhizobium binae]|uniref:radical SAM protein n=1 Tax=Rhizobium binae TaxID=1138190 RepID=UPI001C8358B4|nr:radical SAM protein [Rhizobium binae]MBX4969032.1 hypothetical protein [Rhizobium binae]
MRRVALVSPPWFSVQSPCIQLSALKGFIESYSNVRVDCFFPFLDVAEAIGYNAYRDFQATFVGSIIGSALYYETEPGFLPANSTFYHLFEDLAPPPETESPRYRPLLEIIRDKSRFLQVVESIRTALSHATEELRQYDIIGFSNSYAQLFYSAFIARELGKDGKTRTVIFGGSECQYKSAPGILSEFAEVDYVVAGEGEAAFLSIIERELSGKSNIFEKLAATGAIFSAGPAKSILMENFTSLITEDKLNARGQVRALSMLPQIDYAAYLRKLDTLNISQQVRKSLIPLVETGRGCYWSKPITGDEHGKGCAFCGEKNLWVNYRKKSARRVAAEIFDVVREHSLETVYLSDSAISHAYGKEIFEALPVELADTKFVMNIRADTPFDVLKLYRARSITHMTVGFEAISTGILKVMNKGTTAIDNIAVLKYVERLGINHDGVIICFHPGVDSADIVESIDNVDFFRYYKPLYPSRFHLLATSPMRDMPEAYGISNILNHQQYSGFMPSRAFETLDLYRKSFDWVGDNHKELWLTLEDRARSWAADYETLKSMSKLPLLYQHKGPSFTKVVKRSLSEDGRAQEQEFILRGWQEMIYLNCFEPMSVSHQYDAANRVENVPIRLFERFIEELKDEKILFQEDDKILALAVPLDGSGELRFFDFGD